MVTNNWLAPRRASAEDILGYLVWKYLATSSLVAWVIPAAVLMRTSTMALLSLSACKGNGFKERPGRSASLVACLFCLFEVVGTQLDGGGGTSKVAAKVASPAPDWGCHAWRGSGRDRALTSLVSFLQMTREVRRFVWALAKVARDVSACWRAALYS